LQIKRGLSIGHTHGADRDAGDHRRGPISKHDQAARWVNFLDTLMRHFLSGAVGGLALRVVAFAGRARLVAARRRLAGRQLAGLAAGLAAILLPSVTAPADVEDRSAVTAAALAEAVIERQAGA